MGAFVREGNKKESERHSVCVSERVCVCVCVRACVIEPQLE